MTPDEARGYARKEWALSCDGHDKRRGTDVAQDIAAHVAESCAGGGELDALAERILLALIGRASMFTFNGKPASTSELCAEAAYNLAAAMQAESRRRAEVARAE